MKIFSSEACILHFLPLYFLMNLHYQEICVAHLLCARPVEDMPFWEFTGQKEDEQITHISDNAEGKEFRSGSLRPFYPTLHFTQVFLNGQSVKPLWSLFLSHTPIQIWFYVSSWVNHLLMAALIVNSFHMIFRISTPK